MKCRQTERALPALIDNEIAAPWRRAIEVHLQNCASCRARCAEIRASHNVLRSAINAYPRIAASPDFDARVWQKIAAREAQTLPLWLRIDAIFARPLPKLAASATGGIVFGFLLVAPLLLANRGASSNDGAGVAALARGEISPEVFYTRHDAHLWLDFALSPGAPRPQTSNKENAWNAESRAGALPPSLLSGSLC